MTLALRLGRTVEELLSTLTARELKMWIEYDRISPIGDHRGDVQAALIASSVYQSQGGKANLDDLVLKWGAPAEEEEVSSLEEWMSCL